MAYISIAERLKELATLRGLGELTEEEYAEFKEALLRGSPIEAEAIPTQAGGRETSALQPGTSSSEFNHTPNATTRWPTMEGEAQGVSEGGLAVAPSMARGPSWTCPYCASEMSADRRRAVCANCGWHNGLVPLNAVYDSSGKSATLFGAEPRLPHARSSLFWLTVAGLITIPAAGSAGAEGIGFALVGVLELVMAITVAYITRFGREYYRLSPSMRMFAKVTLGIGRVFTWASFIGVLIGFFGGDWIRGNA